MSTVGNGSTTSEFPSSRALALVAPRPWPRQVAMFVLLLIVLIALALKFVPWQQSVTGSGEVIVYDAMQRPQSIEAQIPGRLVAWKVQEGDAVRAGDTLALLRDIESRFLDPEQVQRMRQRRAFLLQQREAAETRAGELNNQMKALSRSRSVAIPAAEERARQAEDRYRQAVQALEQTRQAQRAAKDASVPIAQERIRQAEEQKLAAEQNVAAAKQRLATAQLNFERMDRLYRLDLRSRRDYELAELELVQARTGVEIADRQVEVARRAVTINTFDQTQVDTVVERARQEVERARAALDIAQKDTTIFGLDQRRIANDTAATISGIAASLNAANESIASLNNSIVALDVELQNVEQRAAQQKVVAPRDGRIVSLMKVGAGETVKAGDVLAVLAPFTQDQHVQLMLSDNDAPLVSVGRKVRLQFAGWPAIQFTGNPSVAVGTFGGVVKVIDAIDDGTSRYRIIVGPDRERIRSGKDQPWPPFPDVKNPNAPLTLRPGAQVIGWVMLDTVSLGYELWRQFNAFPPTVKREFMGEKGGKDETGKGEKGEKEKAKNGVKRRAKEK